MATTRHQTARVRYTDPNITTTGVIVGMLRKNEILLTAGINVLTPSDVSSELGIFINDALTGTKLLDGGTMSPTEPDDDGASFNFIGDGVTLILDDCSVVAQLDSVDSQGDFIVHLVSVTP